MTVTVPKSRSAASNGCGHQCMVPYKGICHINVWASLLPCVCCVFFFFLIGHFVIVFLL